jgi:replication factor A1
LSEEEPAKEAKDVEFIKIKDLKAEVQPGINIIARVFAKSEPRMVNTKYGKSRVCDVKIGDDTGTVTLSLWGSKINEVAVGDIIQLVDGFCREWRGFPQVSIGRNGVMTIIEKNDFPSLQEIQQKFIDESETEED